MCSAAPRVSRQRAKEMRHQLGRQCRRPARDRSGPPRRSTAGPTDRAPPAPRPRPWRAGSRSGRCRSCRPAPRAAPRRAPGRNPRPCDARRCADRPWQSSVQREAAVLGDLLQHVIEEPDAGGDAGSAPRATDRPRPRRRSPWSCARSGRAAPRRGSAPRSPARSPRRCRASGRAVRGCRDCARIPDPCRDRRSCSCARRSIG